MSFCDDIKSTLTPEEIINIVTNILGAHTYREEEDFIIFPTICHHIDSEEYKKLWSFAQNVAKKVKIGIPCVRVGVAVVGLEVPHAHIHLIPLNQVEDMNFKNERLKLTPGEYIEIQNSIINS